MGISEIFSSELYNAEKFYEYFSEEDIKNIPFDLYNLIDIEQKYENQFTFQNFVAFFSDLYVSLNINDKDFKYIDSKLDEIGFSQKFSEYLYSDFLIKKEGAIFVFAKMRKKSNCKYLEEVFINEYYKKNPILTSRCLKELFYLESNKANEYEKLLFENIDIINFITIILLCDKDLSEKVLELYKNEEFLKNIKINDIEEFIMSFEIFISNLLGVNKIKDFKRDEYINSFNYYIKIYGSYEVKDFNSFYKKSFQELKINT